jgi:ATP-dependent DNA helicase RecG
MRPALLNPLFTPVTSLSGVGPKQDKLFRYLLGRDETPRLVDLLLHLPASVIDRRARPKIRDAVPGTVVTLEVTVERHRPTPGRNPRAPHLVYASDDTGDVVLTYFRSAPGYVEKLLPVGAKRFVSGTLQMFDGIPQIVHPDRVVDEAGFAKLSGIDPVYPLTEGLALGSLRRAMAQALQKLPGLPEWISPEVIRRCKFPTIAEALNRVHMPVEMTDILPDGPFWSRLAFDELLAGQLALALVRAQLRRPAGDRNAGDGHLRKTIIDALPYSLTSSQQQAAAAISDDLRQPVRMLRLLQGDVGSGKTVVALLAAAAVSEVGKQAALMAPTEILARQHIKTITPLAERAGLRVAILTGREKGKERRELLARLAAGDIDLVVGTHALIQDDVAFKALALAVVDEQHRFGVRERLALTAKGDAVDVLVLSATPIPRTLVLTYFGDMDISELREKPAGRQPIDTRAVPNSRLNEVMDGVGRALHAGKLVYWICPLVEESEAEGIEHLTNATERYETLQKRFGGRVGLVHGQMKGTEKDRVMAQFAAGEIGLLVATTVVEVGVDVPAATIMVIENAERFGLAQLHQLRGRIGRGSEASTCLLLYKEPLNEMSTARLKVIRETTDGFRIAEEDLKLRGEGDVLGVRQSGLPGYRIARTDVHAQLITQARDEALRIMKDNPRLKGERGEALRALLYLFERDEALPLIGAGGLIAVIPGRVENANPESRDSRCAIAHLRSGPSDHPGMTMPLHSTFTGTGCSEDSCATRAAFATPASAAIFFCGSEPGCTTPADMIKVAASSALISISMILLLGT